MADYCMAGEFSMLTLDSQVGPFATTRPRPKGNRVNPEDDDELSTTSASFQTEQFLSSQQTFGELVQESIA